MSVVDAVVDDAAAIDVAAGFVDCWIRHSRLAVVVLFVADTVVAADAVVASADYYGCNYCYFSCLMMIMITPIIWIKSTFQSE